MSLGPAVQLTARPSNRLFHLVFDPMMEDAMGGGEDIASIVADVNRWSAPCRA